MPKPFKMYKFENVYTQRQNSCSKFNLLTYVCDLFILKQDESSDSEQDEEENLQHEIGGLIYTGLVENIFKIPDDQKMYLLSFKEAA